MKKLEALIKPYKLEEVKQALAEVGLEGMTVGEVKGFGKQKGILPKYYGIKTEVDFVPKIKIELVVPDAQLELAEKTIIRAAKTGKIGDGKIFVLPIDEVVRIRTGATGERAV